MKGYWLAFVEITQPEEYQKYLAEAPQALKKYGAKILARGDELTALEGFSTPPHRAVVFEFESYEQALNCYHSKEYQEAKNLRKQAANANIIIMKGQ